jgi:ribosomal protein L37E
VKLGEIVMLVLFLAVFVVVPILFIQFGSRRSDGMSHIQVCPACGAHNYKTKTHCYCCGFGFILLQSDKAEDTIIQRAKQADDSNRRGIVKTELVDDARAITNEPL